MAILIKLDYGKKLGLPQYSSHQFSVSLTAEITDLSQLPAEAERLYAALQHAVDSQIVKAGYVPGEAPPDKPTPTDPDAWSCSPAQKKLILDLVERHKIEKAAVEALAKERFGCGVRQLNRLTASGLIDELLERCGETKPKFNGRSTAPRRPNGYATRRVP